MLMSAIKPLQPDYHPVLSMADRDSAYHKLMIAAAHGGSDGYNTHLLATILANWHNGATALGARLGLSRDDYRALFKHHFAGILWPEDPAHKGETDFDRLPERAELVQLLLDARAGRDPSEVWLADIIAAACMGMDHLWQDMGLWSRRELSELMQRNFPDLAQRNTHNMKWKKFLYKQLCEQQGIYVCRAPSCDVCSDYNVCFGSEE